MSKILLKVIIQYIQKSFFFLSLFFFLINFLENKEKPLDRPKNKKKKSKIYSETSHTDGRWILECGYRNESQRCPPLPICCRHAI